MKTRQGFLLLRGTLVLITATGVANVSAQELEEVVVTAHEREYRLDSADSALGIDMKLLETPAAVSVITEDLLKDQQVNNVDDALRNVAGVNKFKTGNGGEERFSIRGFDASQSIYKDGARINNALNVSNIPSTETANLERIEVLKGSSALLYGQGEPGGIINYVTKRPEFERYTSVELLYGSDDFKKLEFDTTGAFADSETFAYRLVGAYEDSENFRDVVTRERILLNPTLAIVPGERTELLFGYEYIDDDYTQDRGQGLEGNSVDGYVYGDRLSEDLFFGIPGWNDQTEAESNRLYFIGEHRFSKNWQVELQANYTKNEKTNYDSSISFVAGDFTVIGDPGTRNENLSFIGPRLSDGEGEARRIDLKNVFDFDTGSVNHNLLASLSYEDFESESEGFRADRNVSFNVVTQEYFTADRPVLPGFEEVRLSDDVVFGLLSTGNSLNQDQQEAGINVMDYIRFNEQWALLIGGRYSDYEDKLNDFEDDNFSLRTGVVYSPRDNLSFYASYSEGYVTSSGRLDENDDVIDPETSVSWELGAKLQLFDEQLLLTATIYTVEKEDVAYVVNPDDPPEEQFFNNLGSIESKGLELEAVGFITPEWRVQAGYAYIDSEILEGGEGDFGAFPEGNSLAGIAPHSFNVFSFYELSLGEGFLGLGGGVFYQDDVYISAENFSEYDSWTQVDLAAYYKFDRWKIQLNVRNVTDETYQQAQSGAFADWFSAIRVGSSTPRSYVASLAFEI